MTSYEVDGPSTPLWDSVNKAIETISSSSSEKDVYLVMVITDGEENSSVTTAWTLKQTIKSLQATDRWTFVFRVPVGSKQTLINLGIPEGNIVEWEQTEKSLRASTEATVNATRSYFSAVAQGATSSQNFYTNLNNVKPADLRRELNDITDKVHAEPVWDRDQGTQIRDFCQKTFGEFEAGKAYYQLSKKEKVQDYKKIIVKHKKKGKYYSGDVRSMLGLPTFGEIKLSPGDHPDYEIYIESRSVNRKLVAHTKVLYI